MKNRTKLSGVEDIVRPMYSPIYGIHGWNHVVRVVEYGIIVAQELCPNYMDDVIIACYLHDIGRMDDGTDPKHGYRGAVLAKKVINKYWNFLDVRSITFAIKHHSDRNNTKGKLPIISNYAPPKKVNKNICAALWDADRLDLPRIIEYQLVNTDYLHSEFAKKFANTEEHVSKYIFNKKRRDRISR